jgi:hypothetical protein
MIFLITTPGQSVPKAKRAYTLQTTQSIEFDDVDACKTAREAINESIKITDTIALVSKCLPKSSTSPATAHIEKKLDEQKNPIIPFRTFD